MVNWRRDEKFERELKKLVKKESSIEKGLEKGKKLLAIQFDPYFPRQVIEPGKIHRIHKNDSYSVWKLEVVLEGNLGPSQWPRLWFMVCDDTITFLAIASHTKDYDDNTMADRALDRAAHSLLKEA